MDNNDDYTIKSLDAESKYQYVMNVLCKWRSLLAGRWLGTRHRDDPESKAARDLFEKMLILRVEVTAVTRLLVEKGLCTKDEMLAALTEEALELDKLYEKSFPGFRTCIHGIIVYDQLDAAKTTKGWKP